MTPAAVWSAVAVAALSAFGGLVPRPSAAAASVSLAGAPEALQSQCPSGTLPDNAVCIPVPSRDDPGLQPLSAEQNRHRDKLGNWVVYDQVPRRPDRPADYRNYRFPVPPLKSQSLVLSGYDLHLHDADQRRGSNLKAVGHGGIDLAQRRNTEVRLVNLEHQVGDADVVFVGELFGNSVVTRHALREGGQLREYVVIYGHLAGPAPGLKAGDNVREGSLVGFVGDSGSAGDVHLHLEIRRVRPKVDISQLVGSAITKSSNSVVCDPRNVLPLAQ
ncbi:MAG: M23 family metallopeptidase [Polyangiaceae bacterium]